jgi:hypothetical protein
VEKRKTKGQLMKKLICSALTILALMTVTAGRVQGQSGKETRSVSDFSEISFGTAGNLHIRFGSQYSVVLEGDREYLSEIETVVKNGRLLIRHENNFRVFNGHRIEVYITMPALKSLGVSGSGIATVEDAFKVDNIDLSVSGSGKIEVGDISASAVDCGISGSGDINLKGPGEIGKGDFSISGSGSFRGDNVKIEKLEVRISGSGNCSCNVKNDLKASVSGSGNVWYTGSPRVDARVSGSGHVRTK